MTSNSTNFPDFDFKLNNGDEPEVRECEYCRKKENMTLVERIVVDKIWSPIYE